MSLPQVERLVEVMATLRQACPWDAQQTHRSLVQYLIEETAETVEAIEGDDRDHLREELGDLLLQVVFHAEIAAESDAGFDLDDVAAGVADKLIARHPYVFASEDVPADLHGSWEQRKAKEKGRRSVLEGIPEQLSSLARANKIISRARSRNVPIELAGRADRRVRRSGPSCWSWWRVPRRSGSIRIRRFVTPYAVWSVGPGRRIGGQSRVNPEARRSSRN